MMPAKVFCFVNTMFCYLLFGSVFVSYSAYIFYITHDIIYTTDIKQNQKNTATNAKYFLRSIFHSSSLLAEVSHNGETSASKEQFKSYNSHVASRSRDHVSSICQHLRRLSKKFSCSNSNVKA